MSILNMLQREKDYAAGKKIGGPVQDDNKAMKMYKIKEEKQRQALNKNKNWKKTKILIKVRRDLNLFFNLFYILNELKIFN